MIDQRISHETKRIGIVLGDHAELIDKMKETLIAVISGEILKEETDK